jgi:hypothetical protein
VSDIDTAMVDSLKVLDPNRPIREAEVTLTSPTRLTHSEVGTHTNSVLSRCTVGVTGLIATRLKSA